VERRKNRTKASVRSKVEWHFRILKRIFGFTKVRYRGLKTYHQWLLAAFALVNLYQHRKRLVPLGARLSKVLADGDSGASDWRKPELVVEAAA
jgi:hypothetical protein